ncbi:hypothetical protein C7444_101344 [Sphaerotilus hippei]|uniref:Sporulation related protein n=1 Tax=Sphaerotilus hippei TaxID=744406 RepID=A0A318H695_9BURK|nr:SPOR domain-containing protein [Sphaerotilus hippei]PXW99514.1 hypothetical protein C7444_101344 [Sphaerotilus hippei]
MLRGLVLLLVAANLLFFGWTQGWLRSVIDLSPEADREPQRIAQQVQPDLIRPVAPGSLVAPPPICLEAGPFTPAEFSSADNAVRALLPQGGWAVTRLEKPGVWLVYMGRYAKPEAMQRRIEDLKKRNIGYTEVEEPATLVPGLSLGRFNGIEEAREAVRRLESQRLRSARIVTLTPPTVWHTIRVPAADVSVQESLKGIGAPLHGKRFQPCRNG